MTIEPDPSSTATELFGPYEVYERLGKGGMAQVHRAKKRGIAGFERPVALKRMLAHLADDTNFVESFIREAKVASHLVHPNIAQIYDFGRIDGVYFIAMEHVVGFDMRRILRHASQRRESLPLGVVLSVLCELCDALEYAHTFADETGTPLGIVHRDVSPSNLIVANTGHVKVIDFGIAKASTSQLHTESGRVKGKLGYMSPEAAMGYVLGPVSDVFSVGVVAHELLTTAPLFTSKTDFETMVRIREGEITPPSRRNPQCPPDLDQVVLAALEREPRARLPTAGAFRHGLDSVAHRLGIRISAREVADWMIASGLVEAAGRAGSGPGDLAARSGRVPTMPLLETGHTTDLGLSQLDETLDGWAGANAEAAASLPDDRLARLDSRSPDPRRINSTIPSLAVGQVSFQPGTFVGAPLAPPPLVAPRPSQAQPPRRRWGLIALVAATLVAVAAVAGYALWGREASPTPNSAPAAPATATVRFEIQPADAIIELGGREVARSSPHELELELEPGVYSIAIRKDGFVAQRSSLTLHAGDRQTVNLALEAVPAVADPRPEPPPKPVIDPVIEKPAPTKPGKKVRPAGKRGGKDVKDVAKEPDEVTISELEPAPPPPTGPTVHEPPPAPPPVPDVPAPAKPARTPVVSANAVTKLKGEIPPIKAASGEGASDVLAKVCIDEQGRVTGVTVKRATAEIATQLQTALLAWRYKPYVAAGAAQPSAVCFPLSLHIVVGR